MNKSKVVTISILVLVLIVIAVVTYYFYVTPNDDANSDALKDLQTSETAVYTDLEGNPFSFKEFEGKVRVVNVWASWSPFSTDELQNLNALAAEFEAKEVAVIAVNRKEPKEQAKRFLATLPELGKIHFAIDLTDAFYTSIGGYAMPETVFYDARGNVVQQKKGALTLEEMRTYTNEAIASQR